METTPLTIFFDGKCILCFREVRHYKKLDKNNLIYTIDISDENFDASSYGLDEREVNINMHSKDSKGNVFIGIDTFFEIWKRIPYYNNFTFIFENKRLRPFLKFGYKTFAYYIRPNLPKRKCDSNVCDNAF